MRNGTGKQVVVWWVSWVAFQTSIFAIYYSFANNPEKAFLSSSNSFLWVVALVPVFVSTIIRWGVLPHIQTAQVALQLFIFGIALSESTCFLGLFIFFAQRQALFILSAIAVFQYLPYFAGDYYVADGEEPKT